MNRKQRRALAKREHVKPRTVDALLKLLKLGEIHAKHLDDGDKVRINVDKILARKSKFQQRYVDFLKEHRNQVFTVEHCENEYSYIVELVEDSTEPKWLWHVDDLIKVEETE